MTHHRGALVSALALVLTAASGCTSYVTPHQLYAPLLDHAGQVDISVRGGPTVPGAVGVNANVAYAPIDSLEIVAGGDFNFGSETRHYAGHVGIGTFAREDVLRLEATAGCYGGYAEGYATGVVSGSGTTVLAGYRLEGPYAMPYGQVLIGFESGRFELAGGVRAFGFLSDVGITPARSVARTAYERFYVEPVLTIRIPFDVVRIDFMMGFPINIAGVSDNSPADLAPESYDLMWYLAVGVGFQIDTIDEAEPPPEPEYTTPAPVYAPTPVPGPYVPATPPGYAPAPATAPGPLMTPVPAPAPAPTPAPAPAPTTDAAPASPPP